MPRPIPKNPPAICFQAAFLILLLCSVLLSQDPRPRIQPRPQPLPTLDRSEACSGTHWLGELLEKPYERQEDDYKQANRPPVLRCPPGWEWVFASRINPAQPPPPGLQRFCRYLGGGDPRPRYRKIESPFVEYHYFERIERDCRIVGPAAETIFPPTAVAPPLHDRFVQQARGVGENPASLSDEEVRLVVVDSVQDDANSPQCQECTSTKKLGDLECSPHGVTLVKLARDLLCAGSNCGAQITTRRALAWTHEIRSANRPPNSVMLQPTDDPFSPVQGGSSGTAEDLARAIRREVEEWWQEWEATGKPRLILNLSLGWEQFNASEDTLKAETVRAAIEDAVCRGALVIAAAGNRVSGPPEEVEIPLLPAAWEDQLRPQDCQLEESAQPEAQSSAPYQPLVFAVGGVQLDNKPLANSRPNATPRLVAFGDHAAVLSSGTPPRMSVLTGTSVSTLVVSAAAAERWRQSPQLDSLQVMQTLWDEHEPTETNLPVDFGTSNSSLPLPEKARRIFVRSPAPQTPPSSWPLIFNASLMANLLQSMDPPPLAISPAQCKPALVKILGTVGSNPVLCPQRLYDVRSQPWLGPQPEADHNPTCSYSQGSPGTLVLEFDPCYRVEGRPVRIDDFTLIAGDEAYRLPMEGFELGNPSQPCPLEDDPRRVQVVLTGFSQDDPPHPMYLAVTVDGQLATLSPILQVIK